MPDVDVTCGACKGARFNSETLEVTVRGKTIDDVLNMSVEESVAFFAREPAILDVIKTADHVIDLGPEGGHAGGEVVATGTPEEIAACTASHTGFFLKSRMKAAGR